MYLYKSEKKTPVTKNKIVKKKKKMFVNNLNNGNQEKKL